MASCRLLVLVALSLALAAGEDEVHPLAEAGKGMEKAVTAALASDEVLDQAWGAYRAGQLGMEDAVPRLRELLAERLEAKVFPREITFLCIADALVRLDTKGPGPALVAGLLERRFPHGAILASRDPARYVAVLRQVAEGPHTGTTWAAAVNLLVEIKDQTVMASLLDGLPLRLEVVFTNDGEVCEDGLDGRWHLCEGRGAPMVAFARARGPNPWPPMVLYKLHVGSQNGNTVVAPGGMTVGYRCLVSPKTFIHDTWRVDRADYALRCAAHALYTDAEGLVLRLKVDVPVCLEAGQDPVGRVAVRRESAEKLYANVLERLVRSERLPAERARTMKPVISVEWYDGRIDKEQPLPELPEDWKPWRQRVYERKALGGAEIED